MGKGIKWTIKTSGKICGDKQEWFQTGRRVNRTHNRGRKGKEEKRRKCFGVEGG